MTLTLQKDEERLRVPGYEAFMNALQATYNLQDLAPEGIKWAEIITGLAGISSTSISYLPSVAINVADDHPQVSVLLRPYNNGQIVTGADIYQAPVLIRDVQTWEYAKNSLGRYEIIAWKGVKEEEEMFDTPQSLAEIISDKMKNAVTDTTKVVEALALIPIAPNGEFETEFAPQVMFGTADHAHYKVGVIAGDRLSAYLPLTEGGAREIKDKDALLHEYNWKAGFIPAMTELEQLFLPSSAGHMILIALPYEKPRRFTLEDDLSGLRGLGARDTSGPGPLTLGGQTKEVTVGGVDISRGSMTGQGHLYEGTLENSRKGNATIFHIRFIGIRPDSTGEFSPKNLNGLEKALDTYNTI